MYYIQQYYDTIDDCSPSAKTLLFICIHYFTKSQHSKYYHLFYIRTEDKNTLQNIMYETHQ